MDRWKYLPYLLFICVFACLITPGYADDPIVIINETNPLINPIERAVVAEINSDIQLTCVVENKPLSSEVQWNVVVNRNGTQTPVPISTSTRTYDSFKYLIDNPSPTYWRLRIQNAQTNDEGLYRCDVLVSAQSYARATMKVMVVESPQIADLMTSSDITKSAGESLTLTCAATGRPQPLIKWSRMAGELMPSGGRELLNSNLVISILRPDHDGIYKCTAINWANMDYRDIRVTVTYAPDVTAQEIVQQAPGYVKELICNVKGNPTPDPKSITWTKMGAALGFDDHIFVRNIPGASSRITSILVIWGVRESDYGTYRCGAVNEKGSDYVDIQLKKSNEPTPDRTNQVRAGASIIAIKFGTVIMILSVCLLHQGFG